MTVVRQTFVLEAVQGARATALTPAVTYDPAARVVTLTPLPGQGFDPAQTYRLVITRPSTATDTNGLRAIDGATLAPSSMTSLTFQIASDGGLGTPPPVPTIDFCSNILPMLQSKCQGSTCHGGLPANALPAEGLLLTQTQGVLSTAIGRVSEESNNGPQAGAGEPASLLFAQDVPIVDPGPLRVGSTDAGTTALVGDPGHSWLMYKLLMAASPACSSTPGAAACDGGAAPADASYYTVFCGSDASPCPQPLADTERATLANLIPGREMPYPTGGTSPGSVNPLAMTTGELELVSLWIAQGAQVPASCP